MSNESPKYHVIIIAAILLLMYRCNQDPITPTHDHHEHGHMDETAARAHP